MSVKTTTVYNCDYCQKQLPDDCRLKFLKMAVEHLERKVAAEKEGLNNDGEETDV